MATSNKDSDKQENVLQSLEENIRLVSQQIKDGESKRDITDTFVKDEYWNRMSAIFKLLSVETTKISLAFSKKPFPSYQNTEQMVVQLEKAMLTLVSAYYSLPDSQGSTLRSHLQQNVLQVLESLSSFTSAVADCLNQEKSKDRIQWTGGVWQATDFVMLTDNKQCVKKEIKETLSLVGDALGEIKEAQENEGQMDDFLAEEEDSNASSWSEQDKDVVEACSGLVKVTKMVLKKTFETVSNKGEVDTEEGVLLLDELVGLTKGVSSKVDDFVCCIYAPMNYTALVFNGKLMAKLTDNILKFLRDSKLTDDNDIKWLDFLTNANSHNLDKLEKAVLPQNEAG